MWRRVCALCLLQLAGPDNTIRHLLEQSTLAPPPLADSLLTVFVSHMRGLYGAEMSTGSTLMDLDIMDQIAVLYFLCLLPLCLFASKRLERVSRLYSCNDCKSGLMGSNHSPEWKVSSAYGIIWAFWRGKNRSIRIAFCAVQQVT